MDMLGIETNELTIDSQEIQICTGLADQYRQQGAFVKQEAPAIAATVVDAATAQAAANWCAQRKNEIDEIKKGRLGYWGSIFNKAHKAFTSKREEFVKPFDDAILVVDYRIRSFHREQEMKRIADQQRLQAEATRRAEEAKLAQAVKLEEQGRPELANVVLDRPTVVPMPNIAPVKTQGFSVTKKMVAVCTDKTLLIKFIANHPMYQKVLDVNEPELTRLINSLDGSVAFDGVELQEKEQSSYRKRYA